MSRSFADHPSPSQRRRWRASCAVALSAVTLAGVTVSVASAGGVQDDPTWGLDRIDQQALPLDSKYSHKYSGKGVTVYVFGTGIHENHSEIFGRATAAGESFDDVWGTRDCDGAGTHAAATIGGRTWGVAKDATIVSLQTNMCNISLAPSTFGGQFAWVVNDHDAGEPAVAFVDFIDVPPSAQGQVDELAQSLLEDGITVVTPAGDDPSASSCDHAPGRLPGVITVAASTQSDERWSGGSAGSCVDLYAPGVDIQSAGIATIGASAVKSGTSQAAAHVAGVIAQLLEEDPSSTPAEVWNTMSSRMARNVITGVPTGETDDLVQVMRASRPGQPTLVKLAVAPEDGVRSGEAQLTWEAPRDDGGAPPITYIVERAPREGTWSQVAEISGTSYRIQGLTNGTIYDFRVTAKNVVGVGNSSHVWSVMVVGEASIPSSVRASAAPERGVGSGEVKLAWLPPDDDGGTDVFDYVISKSVDLQTWTPVDDGVSMYPGYTVDGLTNGTRYFFRIVPQNAVGLGQHTQIAATPVWKPEAPAGLTAAPGGQAGEVALTWTAPANNGQEITDYHIESSTDGVTWTTVADDVSTATTYTVGGLAGETNYAFRVAAENAIGVGPASAVVSAAPSWAPAAPAGLTAAPGGQTGEVTLTWAAPAHNGQEITDYHIESSTDGVTWTTVADDVSIATTYTVGGLAGETNYSFRVAAENAIGVGPVSDVVSAAPLWTPAAPDQLTASAAPAAGVASGEVDVSWAAPAGNGADVTDYVIESSPDGVTWTTVDDGESPATTATVAGLSNGTRYRFRVAAVNIAGVGPASAETAATPRGTPGAPSLLQADVAPTPRVRSGQVKLTWSAPANGGLAITDYVIQRSRDGTTWRTVDDGVSPVRSRILGGLANGTPYQFRVAARNAVGMGPWSATIDATPRWKPAAPRFVRARAGLRAGQVRLTWNAPSDRGSPIRDYVIQRLVGGTTWRTVDDGVSTSTSRMLGGLSDGARHRFRVAAQNAVGRGQWSATVLVILRNR